MRRIFLVAVICLSVLACGQPAEKSLSKEKQEAQVWLTQGLTEFQKEGEIDRAIASFQKASELDPQSAAAYNMMGEAYLAKGSRTGSQELKEKAMAAFRRAVEVNPNYWPALINLGNTYYVAGDKAKAALLFKKGLALNPQHPWKAQLEKMISEEEGKP